MWGLVFLLILLIPLLAVILDSQLGRALARRIEGGAPESARLARLESELERLSAEVERLREQAEFTTRLLEERGGGRRLPAGEDGG
ncbi:MAG TPA: hypothetical protein VMM12_11185 [Longimicrobiales bacterium]|nr:hypothetical protein [Longimicrobiales bacterium]